MSCERFDSVLEMEQCKSIVEILTSFCIHNLRALIFLLSPLILAQGVPRQSLRKRQCDISSGHNDFFFRIRTFFTKNFFSWWFQFLFIVCYKAISSTLMDLTMTFLYLKSINCNFFVMSKRRKKKVGASTKEYKEGESGSIVEIISAM